MKETTSGGLYICPAYDIEFDAEYDASTHDKTRKINQQAERYPETPFRVTMNAVDLSSDYGFSSDSSIYRVRATRDYVTNLIEYQHDFVNEQGHTSQSVMFGNEGIIHEFSRADGNEFYNHIAKKVQDNLENGSTSIQELVKYYQRDKDLRKKGLGGAQSVQSMKDIPDHEDDYLYHELVLEELNKVGKATGQGGGAYRFREIIPNAVDAFYAKYDQNRDLNVIHDVAGNLSRTLGSIMIHGVGASHIVDTYLDAFNNSLDSKKRAADLTDMFLGGDGDGVVYAQRLRALPVDSKYHHQLVRNIYKNVCEED